jgi:NADH:ubiquinone oxidoreductase subunit 6 (subunit J)
MDAGLFAGAVADLDVSAEQIGAAIFGKWLLAFEVTSLLLLGAILGAVILTKRRLT